MKIDIDNTKGTLPFVVYKITNNVNGHYYFGKSSRDRLKRGYSGSGTRLWEAYRKYGKKSFSLEVLFEFSTEEQAYQKERELVTLLEVLNPKCYNVQEGGLGGTKGFKLLIHPESGKIVRTVPNTVQQFLDAGYLPWKRNASEETRAKMRQSHLGKPGTMKGRKHSEETRRKISEAGKGRKRTEAQIQAVREKLTGVPRSQEVKDKIRRKLLGRVASEEAREKMRQAKLGGTPWNKGKQSTTPNRYWVNNGQVARRVSKEEKETLISAGWFAGKKKNQ